MAGECYIWNLGPQVTSEPPKLVDRAQFCLQGVLKLQYLPRLTSEFPLCYKTVEGSSYFDESDGCYSCPHYQTLDVAA